MANKKNMVKVGDVEIHLSVWWDPGVPEGKPSYDLCKENEVVRFVPKRALKNAIVAFQTIGRAAAEEVARKYTANELKKEEDKEMRELKKYLAAEFPE
jgi:hypothetical protein